MYIAIIKAEKKGYSSKSRRSIAFAMGKTYSSICYYYRKGYYENEDYIFCNSEYLKSNQGGLRNNNYLIDLDEKAKQFK